jgi:hypothetical protein
MCCLYVWGRAPTVVTQRWRKHILPRHQIHIHWITRCHIPEDYECNIHHCVNLISHIDKSVSVVKSSDIFHTVIFGLHSRPCSQYTNISVVWHKFKVPPPTEWLIIILYKSALIIHDGWQIQSRLLHCTRIQTNLLKPTNLNLRELVLAISLISLGSSHTFFLPHLITEAASLFCSLREL